MDLLKTSDQSENMQNLCLPWKQNVHRYHLFDIGTSAVIFFVHLRQYRVGTCIMCRTFYMFAYKWKVMFSLYWHTEASERTMEVTTWFNTPVTQSPRELAAATSTLTANMALGLHCRMSVCHACGSTSVVFLCFQFDWDLFKKVFVQKRIQKCPRLPLLKSLGSSDRLYPGNVSSSSL